MHKYKAYTCVYTVMYGCLNVGMNCILVYEYA